MNLIQPNTFYYHPKLQKSPPPPTVHINDDGSIGDYEDTQEFYLLPVKYVDYNLILKYIQRKFKENFDLPIFNEASHNSAVGQIKYVYENFIIPFAKDKNPLDLCLFIIDATAFDYSTQGRKLNTIFELKETNCLTRGMQIYEDKITMSRLDGLDHYIRREE